MGKVSRKFMTDGFQGERMRGSLAYVRAMCRARLMLAALSDPRSEVMRCALDADPPARSCGSVEELDALSRELFAHFIGAREVLLFAGLRAL